MRIKMLLSILCLCALCILVGTAVYAYTIGSSQVIIFIPRQDGRDLSLHDLQEIEESRFPLAYGVEKDQTTQALQKSHAVTLWATNGFYAQILQLPLLSGSYFTPEAIIQSSRTAALNRLAAFNLFGGNACIGEEITLNHDAYTITGVIEDGDTQNANVYIPITCLTPAKSPNTVFVQETAGASLAYMLSILSSAGISETSHRAIRLGDLSRMVQERTLLGAGFLIGCAVMFLAIECFRRCLRYIRQWRSSQGAKASVIAAIGIYGFTGFASLAAIGMMSLQGLGLLLRHSDLSKTLSLSSGLFTLAPAKFQPLEPLLLYSNAALYVLLAGIILWCSARKFRTGMQ